MRYFTILILIFCAGSFLSSCDQCKYLDCIYDNYVGQFRIVRAIDGEDLVFGPGKIYEKDQIKFYSLNGADTTFFEYEATKPYNLGPDSVLNVRFFPQADTAYMQLSNGDIDTFRISYSTYGTKCCGTITEITNYRFNNTMDFPGGRNTQELMK